MQHLGTKQLETDRLILRRFTEDDTADMFNNWVKDPEVSKYLIWQPHANVEETKEYLQGIINEYDNKNFYNWAIMLKENEELVGNISVVKQDNETAMVQIGYCIGQQWWHQGITSEALAALIDFFFDEVGANRVESHHDPRNPHSGMVMVKCGMQHEGILREAGMNNQGRCDNAMYAILASDKK